MTLSGLRLGRIKVVILMSENLIAGIIRRNFQAPGVYIIGQGRFSVSVKEMVMQIDLKYSWKRDLSI